MSAEVMGVWCNGCGVSLPDMRPDAPVKGRVPCPACGSTNRQVRVLIEGKISVHSDLALTRKSRGFKSGGRSRPAQEQRSGEVLSADGVWRTRQRVVDREHNRYVERVVDPDGTVIRDVDELLDSHRGHGSDKAKSNPKEVR